MSLELTVALSLGQSSVHCRRRRRRRRRLQTPCRRFASWDAKMTLAMQSYIQRNSVIHVLVIIQSVEPDLKHQ